MAQNNKVCCSTRYVYCFIVYTRFRYRGTRDRHADYPITLVIMSGEDASPVVPHVTVLRKGDLGDFSVEWIHEGGNTPSVGSTHISMDRKKYLKREYYYKSPSW